MNLTLSALLKPAATMSLLSATLLLATLVFAPERASAEIYRWIDDNGKVHFSDRKPESVNATDVSDTVKRTNVDTSQQEQEKLGKIFAKETDAERLTRERAEAQAHNQQIKRDNYCNRLQKRIRVLSGRTYWSDGKGKEWDMSLEEQKTELDKAQREYNKNCS